MAKARVKKEEKEEVVKSIKAASSFIDEERNNKVDSLIKEIETKIETKGFKNPIEALDGIMKYQIEILKLIK